MNAGFSEMIKNFDKIRDYMRDFYIYGFKTRMDFNRKSPRTYDNERRRIESWLGSLIRFDTSKKGKSISISCDSGQLRENPLFSAYRSKSFTDNDIQLHFFLLDIFSLGEMYNVDELTDILCEKYGAYFEPQTIRLKLKEYSNEGIFLSKKKDRTIVYGLSPDIITDYDLTDMLSFFSETAPLGIAGNYIMKQRGYSNTRFLQKHSFIAYTLEDNILLEILSAIDSKRLITVRNLGKSKRETDMSGLPLRIHVSTRTGRRYVIMYHTNHRRFVTLRLDYIKSVTLGDVCSDFRYYMEKYENNLPMCRGVCFGNRRNGLDYQRIKLSVRLDEKKEQHIISRLERESDNRTITHISDGIYEYEADLFDASEASPWVKTFIGRINFFSCTDKDVSERFYRDIVKMHDIYADKEDQNAAFF